VSAPAAARPLRTALLAWDYPPAPSGLSTAAREIAGGLAEAGAAVTVFTLDRTGRETDGAVTVVGCALDPGEGLARLRLWGSVGHLAAPLAFRRAVLAEHRTRAFDLVEATNWYAPAALLAGRLPVVTRASTPAALTLSPATTLRDRLDGGAARRLERRQARASAGWIANTADHGDRIAALYGLPGRTPSAVIGLSLPPGTLAAGRAAPYPDDGPDDGPVRLVFVGRAEARKGFDLLLDAAARLADEGADFVLTLVGVGAGELPPGLPASLRDRLEPLGRVDEAARDAAYARAHAVLAPSRYESFGLVYQEALAYGRPVVALAEDASARTFVGDAGALAAESTGAALAAAIRPLLADPGLRLAARTRALARAGRFDRQGLGEATLALYRRALAASRPQSR
jgi:glycogen synthase